MFDNSYDGVLDDWKLKLITRRARRMGFRDFELDDAQQQTVLALLHFRFVPARANGACESTAMTAVIDRQLAMIRRSEARVKKRVESAREYCSDACYEVEPTLSIDVAEIIRSLPDIDQRICQGLSLGQSVSEMARQLEVSWHTLRQRIESIRHHFERHGLSESYLSGKETTAA